MSNATAITVRPVASVTYTIPPEDYAECYRLTRAQRAEVDMALAAFRQISEAARGQTMRVVSGLARQIKADHPTLRGWSQTALYAKYRLYTEGGRKPDSKGKPTGPHYAKGDWRCILRNYTNGGSGLPPEFLAHLVAEWSKTTREHDSWRALYHRLKRDWLAGESIPGYGSADEWYPAHGLSRPRGHFVRNQDLPEGWSESNLWRSVKAALPRRSQRRGAQGQVGRMGTTWAGQLLRDRSRLRPMQLWTIDDVRLDLQARMFVDGRWQIVYVDCLFALDVATGYVLGYGIKGQATRGEDTERGRAAGTRMSIDGRDVRHLLISVFERTGLPPYLSTLLCEMATARLNGPDEAAFLALLKDRLAIDYTGMGRGTLLKSGFAEDWGRPQAKGWIESFFHLLHTTLNGTPGTTGRRYDLTRGDHAARTRYTESIIRRAEKLIDGPLTPDHPLAEQIRFPILDLSEVNCLVEAAVDALNWRPYHKLQGFNRVWEHQIGPGEWLSPAEIDQLPAEQRAGLELTPRMEAPAERLQRILNDLSDPFQRLDPATLSALYTEKRPATVKGGRICIRDQRISADDLHFAASGLHDLDAWENRDKALIACFPPDFRHAVLMDRETGAHIATLDREGRIDLTDQEALNKGMGRVHREHQAELAVVRTYLDGPEAELAEMRETNERVLAPSTVPAIRTEMGDALTKATTTAREAAARARQITRLDTHDDVLTAHDAHDDDPFTGGYAGDDDLL